MNEITKRPRRIFPSGCKIINIRPGVGVFERSVYATLIGPDGDLIIADSLEYINQQFIGATIKEETDS